MGQIQPQKKRPRKSVGSRMSRLQMQPAIEGMACQRVDHGNQRIPLEKQAHRRAQMNVAGRRAGRSDVKISSAKNRSRKNICEILRHSGNLERATNLLHTPRAAVL
jgi:hypothetical protein